MTSGRSFGAAFHREATVTKATTGRADGLDGLTILVAEDEYFLATGVARALRAAGATVVGPFAEVCEALTAAERGSGIDGALIDVNLRDAMVYPVADALRRRGVPFVFMTGYDRSALPAAYRDVPICEKPIDIREVARLLAPPPVEP